MVEAELADFIYDYKNDEDEGTFESPPSKKRRFGISRTDKGGDFNEALEKSERHQFKVSDNKEEFGVVFI